MPSAPRLSLNAAAAQVATAFGFTIRYREALEPGSGRIAIVWALQAVKAERSPHTLTLYCQPPAYGGGGWAGWASIADGQGLELKSVRLLDASEGLAGKKSGPLTRARFCEWAAKQAPGSMDGAMCLAKDRAPAREGKARAAARM